MALELNGTTGVSLVQDGVVTAADLSSTLDLSGKTVTLPSGVGGKVLQVVNGTSSSYVSTATTAFIDTGLSASITPSSASNKILVLINEGRCFTNGLTQIGLKLLRDSTELVIYRFTLDANGNTRIDSVLSYSYLDSPSGTSSVTYKTQFNNEQGTSVAGVQVGNSIASITLMEIAG